MYKHNRENNFSRVSAVVAFVFILSFILSSFSVSAQVDKKMTVAMSDYYFVEPQTTGYNSADGANKKYPVILYIPSAENSADIYAKLEQYKFDLREHCAISDDLDFPFCVIVPRNIENAIDELKNALDNSFSPYPIDSERIFVAGYKDGADKALALASEYSEKIAGYIVTSPTVLPEKEAIEKLKLQAGWFFCGSNDKNLAVAKEIHSTVMSFKTDLYDNNVAVPVNSVFTEFAPSEYTNSMYMDDNVVSFMLRFPEKYTDSVDLGTPNGTAGSVKFNNREMQYYLRFPRGNGYPKDGKGFLMKMPLIIELHGSGGESSVEGMIDGSNANYGMEHVRTNAEWNYFRVYPRLPGEAYFESGGHSTKWGSCAGLIVEMINQISAEYNIDTERIYLTGFSLGGYGTWEIAVQYPDLFAALAPCAGDVADLDQLHKISHIPVHIYHGITDPVVSYTGALMPFYRMKQLNSHVVLTSENVGHELTTIMRSEGAAQWLLQFKKGDIQIPDIALVTDVKFDKLMNTKDTVSGKTDPYIKVIVRKVDKIVATDRADENGNFIIVLNKMLKAGDKYNLSIVNIYGSESQQTEMTVIDKKGPGKIKRIKINLNKRTIKGVTEKNATVYVVNKKGKTIAVKKVGKKKKFTIRLKAKIVKKYFKRDKSINVYAVDKSGNKGKVKKIKL